MNPWKFKIPYDKLVIASGACINFWNPWRERTCKVLREVHHAQAIHRKLLLNLMLSDVPGISEEEKRRLLYYVVIGVGLPIFVMQMSSIVRIRDE